MKVSWYAISMIDHKYDALFVFVALLADRNRNNTPPVNHHFLLSLLSFICCCPMTGVYRLMKRIVATILKFSWKALSRWRIHWKVQLKLTFISNKKLASTQIEHVFGASYRLVLVFSCVLVKSSNDKKISI